MTTLSHILRYRRGTAARESHRSSRSPCSSGGLALVYRGPASLPGCPEAAAELLRASSRPLRVEFVGPREPRQLSTASLADAVLYVQPGGAELDDAYRHLRPHRKDIRRFVAAGGRYLGFCLGGYLAGASPGFGLLPGDSDQYITTELATVHSEEDAVVEVNWRGQLRQLYFQDGPCFQLDPRADTTVLATYLNQAVAASVSGFGRGRVGVVGPHPEAEADWFTDAALRDPGRNHPSPANARGRDLGLDLLNEVMRP